MIPANIVCNSD